MKKVGVQQVTAGCEMAVGSQWEGGKPFIMRNLQEGGEKLQGMDKRQLDRESILVGERSETPVKYVFIVVIQREQGKGCLEEKILWDEAMPSLLLVFIRLCSKKH